MRYSSSRLAAMLILACCWLPTVDATAKRGEVLAANQNSNAGRHQRRRAMDNRRRHRNNSRSRYYMQEREEQKARYKRTEQADASLADVWLCYAFALGWSCWFLSSFLNTDLMRFAPGNDSVLVHGNVREVSIESDSLGTGIPTYHALIDYIITVRRNADAARIQVRKSFQTQHLLQQGFANVELLVLPEEPTSSVLKEDWQREVAAQEQAEEDIISLGGFGDMGAVVTGGLAEEGQVKRAPEKEGRKMSAALSRVDLLAKRASLTFSALLVLTSLIGAVQAVHRIPGEKAQFLGWVSVVLGSVLLWPLAMACLRIISTCQRLGRLPTEKSGIILKCDTNAQVGATITEEKIYTQHHETELKKGNLSTRHLDKVNHPGVFESLKNSEQSEQEQQQNNETGDQNTATTSALRREQSLNASADDSACYFVKLPGQKDSSGLVRLDDSSLSTISANSHLSKNNHKRCSVSST